MADLKAFKKEVQSYIGRSIVTTKRDDPRRRREKSTQKLLAYELNMEHETLSRKLSGELSLAEYDVRTIGETLIYWKRITHRTQLQHLFEHVSYTLPNDDWSRGLWKTLINDTEPLEQHLLLLRNASFEDWNNGVPSQWRCNTKTGWIAPVSGRETAQSKALEIGGNADNQEWVYCRTRETQELPVIPNSRIKLSFWAKKIQEGENPARKKYLEVFFHDGSGWMWGFGEDVTENEWTHYETKWWGVPATVQGVSVGVVIYKDGAFHLDDIELHMFVPQ